MAWFGDPWPSSESRAPVCEDDSQRIETPVDRTCPWCGKGFEPGQRGVLVGTLMDGPGGWPQPATEPVHLGCLRATGDRSG